MPEPTPVAPPRAATDRTVTTAYDPFAAKRLNAARLVQSIYLLFGLIEALLLIRFVLRALGANAEAGFAQLMYGITGPLVAPFVGLFGTPQAGGAALELTTLVALIIYGAVGWLLARAAWLMVGETRTATVASATNEKTQIG
jgi:hypothetical protein